MREIKCQGWDKIQRQMRVVSEMDLQQPNNTIFGISYFKNKQGRAIWLSDGEFELMQYTGLRDKNGKEIYEGDILLAVDHGQPERYWGVVIWRVTEFCVSYHKPSNKTWTELTSMANGNCDHWTVIGNIYENPLEANNVSA